MGKRGPNSGNIDSPGNAGEDALLGTRRKPRFFCSLVAPGADARRRYAARYYPQAN
jgi:hypothetical protein